MQSSGIFRSRTGSGKVRYLWGLPSLTPEYFDGVRTRRDKLGYTPWAFDSTYRMVRASMKSPNRLLNPKRVVE
jgi:hypothetical protein